MRLLSVYSRDASDVLWQLLSERTPEQSISHKRMPTREQHLSFIESRPYLYWYLVEVAVDCVDDVALDVRNVGAVYLTKQREIGVGILKQYRGNGYGVKAVKALMARHPGSFLANVNPKNDLSAALFTSMGFKHVQNTFALEAETT